MPSFIEWVTAAVIVALLLAGFREGVAGYFGGAVGVLVMWAFAKAVSRGEFK